jgi:hypothetical protein
MRQHGDSVTSAVLPLHLHFRFIIRAGGGWVYGQDVNNNDGIQIMNGQLRGPHLHSDQPYNIELSQFQFRFTDGLI